MKQLSCKKHSNNNKITIGKSLYHDSFIPNSDIPFQLKRNIIFFHKLYPPSTYHLYSPKMVVWKNNPFKDGTCWYTLEDWHGTCKSPIFRKENDLKATSITMFHVNLQGCIYVRFLECSRIRNFIKLRDSHGNPNGESKLKPPKTATRWKQLKAPGYLTSWWLNQLICKNLRFQIGSWIPLKTSVFSENHSLKFHQVEYWIYLSRL